LTMKPTKNGDDANHHSSSPMAAATSKEEAWRNVEMHNHYDDDNNADDAIDYFHEKTLRTRMTCNIMTFCFILASVALSASAFVWSRQLQHEEYEHHFDSVASIIIRRVQDRFLRTMSAMDNMGVSITSQKHIDMIEMQLGKENYEDVESTSTSTSNIDKQLYSGFPFVTLMDYDILASAALDSTGGTALYMGYYPKVGAAQNHEWQNYTELMMRQTNGGDHGRAPQIGGPTAGNEEDDEDKFLNFVWRRDAATGARERIPADVSTSGSIPADDSSCHFPLWQSVPHAPSLINGDLIRSSREERIIAAIQESEQSVIYPSQSRSQLDKDDIDYYSELLQLQRIDSSALGQENNFDRATTPFAWIYYPVFDEWKLSSNISSHHGKLVGVVASIIYWPFFFRESLSVYNHRSVYATVENTCQEADSLIIIKIQGQDATIISNNEQNGMIQQDFHEYFEIEDMEESWARHQSSATSVPLNTDVCKYVLHVYPSEDMRDSFLVDSSWYLAAGILAFLLVTGIFWTVHDTVQRRRIHIISSDSYQDRLVSNGIFPKKLRQRLVRDHILSAAGQTTTTTTRGTNTIEGDTNIAEESNHHHHGTAEPSSQRMPSRSSECIVNEIIMDNKTETTTSPMVINSMIFKPNAKVQMKQYLNHSNGPMKPIADLYPQCTVLFVDIPAFSGWSSAHEPEQVFLLLESIYQLMDNIARRRHVFKVETIGDTYMAATGLPDSQPDHAIRMARFARDCMYSVHNHLKLLEISLGPETGELRLRMGINSGQVTAGFLGGRKTRFQLFGDTVNTAGRINTTSAAGRIQVSAETAILLINGGRKKWLSEREDFIDAKGKGIMTTYWLAQHRQGMDNNPDSGYLDHSSSSDPQDSFVDEISDRSDNSGGERSSPAFARRSHNLPLTSEKAHQNRLTDWMADLLSNLLKSVIAQRQENETHHASAAYNSSSNNNNYNNAGPAEYLYSSSKEQGATILDEVVEAFDMPNLRRQRITVAKANKSRSSSRRGGSSELFKARNIQLSPEVKRQLRDYVSAISDRYHNNSFHNFEHCSHVTMASIKLLKRIVVPDLLELGEDRIARELHGHTYGIATDALAQFAVGFCALIHDVDHRGVPNGRLSEENPALGNKYKRQSVAEQNSVDIAWNLLMNHQYQQLRNAIFANGDELRRFRQYVVNLVIATDIFNPQMKRLRNQRWEKSFNGNEQGEQIGRSSMNGDNRSEQTRVIRSSSLVSTRILTIGRKNNKTSANLKATIVLEHIIQAADVSHTMQHWHVYTKWNERLFFEMYAAFEAGRAKTDPSEGWYSGELWFFDNYVIPLAAKLKECGVFGVSSDECLQFATENRRQWEISGKSIVKQMVTKYKVTRSTREESIAGFSVTEINNFRPKELDSVLNYLISKGRKLKTFQAWDISGQKSAAIAWLNALHIYDACPASSMLRDRTLQYSILSGLYVCLRTGKILHNPDMAFARRLADRFIAVINSHKDEQQKGANFEVHQLRAMVMQGEVAALEGNFEQALHWSYEVEKIYDRRIHAKPLCTHYEVDHAMLSISNRALWHWMLGNTQEAVDAAKYILHELLPRTDPSNVMNTTMVFLPTFILLRWHTRPGNLIVRQLRDAFEARVIRPQKAGNLYTPAFPILHPLQLLLEILGSTHASSTVPESAIAWILKVESADLPRFLNCMFAHSGVCSSTICMELCLRAAQSIHQKKNLSEMNEFRMHALVEKAYRQARITHSVVCGLSTETDARQILLEAAWKIHAPILQELNELAAAIDFNSDIIEFSREWGIRQQDKGGNGNKQSKPIETGLGPIWMSD